MKTTELKKWMKVPGVKRMTVKEFILFIAAATMITGCNLPQHENTCTCNTYDTIGTTICHCDDGVKQTVIEGKEIQ